MKPPRPEQASYDQGLPLSPARRSSRRFIAGFADYRMHTTTHLLTINGLDKSFRGVEQLDSAAYEPVLRISYHQQHRLEIVCTLPVESEYATPPDA